MPWRGNAYKVDYSLGTENLDLSGGESKWQQERFDYENRYYGKSYEFGGDVNEMRPILSIICFHSMISL